MKETDIQHQIRKSVKQDFGYCHKLTNAFTIGIPDLLIGLPPFAPCVIEVKDLKEVTDKFNRQIDVSPKQDYELKQITEVYQNTPYLEVMEYTEFGAYTSNAKGPIFSGIFVHCVWRGAHYLTAFPRDATHHTYELLADPRRTRKRGVHGYWDVRPLLESIGIFRL